MLALWALAAASCARDDIPGLPSDINSAGQGTARTLKEAVEELDAVLETIDAPTRAGSKRKIAEWHVLGGTGTKSDGTAAEEPRVYLFNFENDEGFALVAADRRVTPVLTVTDRGNLDPGKEVQNPGLAIFPENADTYCRAVTGLPIYVENDRPVYYNPEDPSHPLIYKPDQPIPITPMPDDYTFVYSDWKTVGHTGNAVPCRWTQTSPFNEYCYSSDGRKAFAGCVAVTAGQIMYHHGKNTVYGSILFDWRKMRNVTEPGTGTKDENNLVAKLIAGLGESQNLNMDYGAVADGKGSFSKMGRCNRLLPI